MTTLVIALLTLTVLYLAGRTLAWLRGAPEPGDITYHFGSWIGRLVARMSDNPLGNWKLTLGRHCFVRGHEITSESRAHEFSHSLDMHRLSIPVAVAQCLYQYARYGYRNAPVEVVARKFATMSAEQFPSLSVR